MFTLSTKNELTFSLLCIGIYIVLFSIADNISASIGITKLVTAPLCIIVVTLLFQWLNKHQLKEKYGLCSFRGNFRHYLYFIPLILLASTNLWGGVRMNFSVLETILYVISMICVGFLEEIIFRGFLFQALAKDNVKIAIIISSITFGIGHIVNLLRGAALGETLLQIAYAVAAGFLFTVIFYKGRSLLPCILVHSTINVLSTFANETAPLQDMIAAGFMCVVSFGYGLYILFTVKEVIQ